MANASKVWERNARAHAKRLGGRIRQIKSKTRSEARKVFAGPDGTRVEADTWQEMATRLEKVPAHRTGQSVALAGGDK
jgi:hypothetical protein